MDPGSAEDRDRFARSSTAARAGPRPASGSCG